ncbi:MAG TPA: hypothetical protein DD613_02855 [Firmicutes bacterium]|nr:hypothetical protein [Bacillota bacterium]
MNKGIDVRDFSKMFLLALCKNSEIKKLDRNTSVYRITLPIKYKNYIKCILLSSVENMRKYSEIINIEDYFKGEWERKFSNYFNNDVYEFSETVEYDLFNDLLIIKVNTLALASISDFPNYTSYYLNIMNDLVSAIFYACLVDKKVNFEEEVYFNAYKDYRIISNDGSLVPLEYLEDNKEESWRKKYKIIFD